jgi:hypothetical protein
VSTASVACDIALTAYSRASSASANVAYITGCDLGRQPHFDRRSLACDHPYKRALSCISLKKTPRTNDRAFTRVNRAAYSLIRLCAERMRPRAFSICGWLLKRPSSVVETDCVADDAVRSETVSRPVLPAICDLQGDFQKLQGEPFPFFQNL